MIATVTEADLPELLPLMRGYCDFYEVGPSDDALLAMSRTLIAEPGRGRPADRPRRRRRPGDRLRDDLLDVADAERLAARRDERPVRVRGRPRRRRADALIAACAERCRERGATELAWQTAHTNERARAVYERVGATRDERWLDYSLSVAPGSTTPDS